MTAATASQASTISYSTSTDCDNYHDDDSHDAYRDDEATDSKRASIDITNAPVTISWAQGEQTAELDFDLHFHGPDREAFFKLHGAIGVKASTKPSRRSYTTRIYLYIPPEEIRSLALDTSWPDTISTTPNPTVRLSFVLARTPTLVMPVPEFKSLTPKNKTFGAVLDGVASLACQQDFDILLPRTRLSNERLRLLVKSFSDHDKQPLKSISRLAETKSLYAGRGGYIVLPPAHSQPLRDGARDVVPDTSGSNPPPCYEDVVSSPSPPPPPRKRARHGSLTTDMEKPNLLDFESRIVNLIEDRFASMENRIKECFEGLDRRVSNLEKAVEDVQANVDSIKDQLDEVVEERNDAIDEAKIDLRIELQDFVKDEIEEERARIRERFTTLRQNLSNCLQEDEYND
ncbi:hypothetical protein F4809DRAFT_635654 [Biscogniauxia mediterranea]|nr:hypothetical protein F4809DRAFT_635654 [Biscogniauxia mediterranea]